MVNRIIKLVICGITAIISWLALSYIFFPIKLSAPVYEYFKSTITHMVPLKIFITILFVLFVVFVYEQKVKKE